MALAQVHFRFGRDDGTEAAHSFVAAEDVNAPLPLDTNLLLRLGIQETAGTAASNLAQQFQYSKNGGAWTNITTSSLNVRAVAVGAFTNGQASTTRLSLTGGRDTTNANCTEDGSSGGTANDVPASGHSETVLGFQVRSADVAGGDTLDFRVTVSGPTTSITYTITPRAYVPVSVAPPVGALVGAGVAAATFAQSFIAAAAGALAAIGLAATISISPPPIETNITPDAGQLKIGLEANPQRTPPTGTLAIAGLSSGQAITVTPDAGALALSGLAPPHDLALGPPAGSLTAAGLAPRHDLGIGCACADIALSGKIQNGSVTQVNMRLSFAAGAAFVDFSQAGLLTPHVGGHRKLTIRDSANRALVGWIGAAGVEETYGPERLFNPDMELASNWTSWGYTGSMARSDEQAHAGTYSFKRTLDASGNFGGISQVPIYTDYGLYRLSAWFRGLDLAAAEFVIRLGPDVVATAPWSNGSWSALSGYCSGAPAGQQYILRVYPSTAANANASFYLDDASMVQVLTPSATGVTILSTRGGTEQAWSSEEIAFNPNDPAGYTYTIEYELPGLPRQDLGIPTPSGSLAASGLAPRQGLAIAPEAGSLEATGEAPRHDLAIETAAGALALDGITALVAYEGEVIPPAATLAATGIAPSAVTGTRITPDAGSLDSGSAAPAPVQGNVAHPAVATLALVGIAPTSQGGTTPVDSPVTPPVGTLSLVPVPASGVESWPLTPDAGTLAATGIAPIPRHDIRLVTPAGSLTAAGLAPAPIRGQVAAPSAGAMAASGLAPTLRMPEQVTPTAGALALEGASPTVSPSALGVITPSAGTLSLVPVAVVPSQGTRLTPVRGFLTIGIISNQTALVPTAALALAGLVPTVDSTPLVIEGQITPSTGALTGAGAQAALSRGTPYTPTTGALTLSGSAPVLRKRADMNALRIVWDYDALTGGTPTGAHVKVGTASGVYTYKTTDVAYPTEELVAAIAVDHTPGIYYAIVTAYNDDGESDPSNEITFEVTASIPTVGALALEGAAPDVLLVGRITPPVASLQATGSAPVAFREDSITPSAGALAAEGAAPTATELPWIAPPAGALALEGAAPTVRKATFLTTTTGSLSASGISPTLDNPGDMPLWLPTGSLAFAGSAPIPSRGYVITPPVGSLAASGIISGSPQGTPLPTDTGALALGSAAPRHALALPVPAGTLVLAGVAPAYIIPGDTEVEPSAGAMAITGIAPSTFKRSSITPSAGAITGTGVAPIPIQGVKITTAIGAVTLAGIAPEAAPRVAIQPTAGSLSLSGVAPIPVRGTRITPLVGALAIAGLAPTPSQSTRLTPIAGSALTDTDDPPVVSGLRLTPTAGAIETAGAAPTFSAPVAITPPAGAIVLTGRQPVTEGQVRGETGALALEGVAPALFESTVLTPTAGALDGSGIAPSIFRQDGITPTVGAMALTGIASDLTDTTIPRLVCVLVEVGARYELAEAGARYVLEEV